MYACESYNRIKTRKKKSDSLAPNARDKLTRPNRITHFDRALRTTLRVLLNAWSSFCPQTLPVTSNERLPWINNPGLLEWLDGISKLEQNALPTDHASTGGCFRLHISMSIGEAARINARTTQTAW